LEARILEAVANTPVGVRRLCEINQDWMPGKTTIKKWLRNNQEFAARYMQAKREQIEEYIEEAFEIADGAYGEPMPNIINAGQKIDLRKWYASKLVPKLYGDKPQEEDQQKSSMTINFYPSSQKPKED
jgi:hypothetical protein